MAKAKKVKVKAEERAIVPFAERTYLATSIAAGAAIMVAGRDAIEAAKGAEKRGESFAAIVRSAKEDFRADPAFENNAYNIASALTDLISLLYREEKVQADAAADAAGHKGDTRKGFIRDWTKAALSGLEYAKLPILELVGGKDGGATLIFDWREANAYVLDVPINSTCTTETETETKPETETETETKPETETETETKSTGSAGHAGQISASESALQAIGAAFKAAPGSALSMFADRMVSAALRDIPATGGQLPGVVEWLREIVGAIEADVRAEGVGPMRAEWIAARAKAQAEAEAARLRKLANAEAEARAEFDKAKAEAEAADLAYAEASAKAEAAPDSRKAAKAAEAARQSAEDAGYRLAKFAELAKAAKAARLAG